MSMTIAALLADYRSGQRTPAQMISEWLSRGAADVYANAWIHRADAASLLRRLQALEEQARSAPDLGRLPLFGVPFAVKDNIDVAGMPTLSGAAFEKLLRRMEADAFTTHGFRSAFRDWAGDTTSVPRETAEAALAHRVGDATERAYRRLDAIEKRRALMTVWADYCTMVHGAKVIPMARGRNEPG